MENEKKNKTFSWLNVEYDFKPFLHNDEVRHNKLLFHSFAQARNYIIGLLNDEAVLIRTARIKDIRTGMTIKTIRDGNGKLYFKECKNEGLK